MKEERLMFTVLNQNNYLKEFKQWKNALFLKNSEDNYFVVSSEGKVSSHGYNKIEVVQNYALAFWGNSKNECFHIYDENGNIQKFEGGIIKGLSYETILGYLNVETNNTYYLFYDNSIESLEQVTFICEPNNSKENLICIIKLTTGKDLLCSYVTASQNQTVCVEIAKEVSSYEVEERHKTTNITSRKSYKLKVTLDNNEVYVAGFDTEHCDNEAYTKVVGNMKFVQIKHKICNWNMHNSQYILCEGTKGTKVLYDLEKCTTIQTQEKADDVKIYSAGKEIWFSQTGEDEHKYYTEVYDQTTGKLLKILNPVLRKLESIDMYMNLKIADCKIWRGITLNGKCCVQTIESYKVFCNDVVRIQAFDGYLFIEEQKAEQKKTKKAMSYVYKISNEMTDWNIIIQRQDTISYGNGILFGTKDFIALYAKGNMNSIYYKGILLKEGLGYNEATELMEAAKNVNEENGFIIVQGLGKYFIDYTKKKAYSIFNPKYWIKKYIF